MAEREPTETGFGDELKRHRLLREVSLESIAAATKISVRHLQALERGDFARLPAPVFTRGFIRAYATFLGLDPEEMVNAYLSEIGAGASRGPADTEGGVSRRPSARAVVLGVVAAAVAVLIGAGVWRYARRPRPDEPKAPTLPPVALSPNIRPVPAPAGSTPPAPTTGGSPPPTASPAAAPAAAPAAPPSPTAIVPPLTLALSTNGDCWTEIFSDDRLLFSGVLHGGEARTFEALRSFRLTAGNAGALSLTVNGRSLPPLGQPGEVARDVRIDAASANELLSRRP